MRFEIWLLGQNMEIQDKYWQLLKTSKWNKDRTNKPQYSVLEAIVLENPAFNDLDKLTRQLKKSFIKITDDIIAQIQ
jgi:CRISPR/Cas system-associated endoribonuclease Cas2